MKNNFNKILWIELLMVLLVINYMIITIVFHDNFLKYFRDVILIILLIYSCRKVELKREEIIWLIITLLLCVTFIRTGIDSLSFVSFRKYIFPILCLFAAERAVVINKPKLEGFLKFVLIFFTIISMFGIFQAWVLGDTFLKKLGYQVIYSYGYGREMLNYSFYFGNLGIQRVVSTLSNSNVCGLILGSTLILLLYFYPYVKCKGKNIWLIMILAGYVLTFSRSNFLALFVVIIIALYPHIPHKNKLWGIIGLVVAGVVILGIVQGKDGLVYKIYNWFLNSLNLNDTSIAGRPERWLEALQEAIKHPFGKGFGHVGALGINAGVTDAIDCENSYLAIAIDNGIIVLIAYLVGLISYAVYFSSGKRKTADDDAKRRAAMCGKTLIIYMMIVMFFSNHIYDMEAIAIIYLYIGFMKNIIRNQRWETVTCL